MAVYVGSQQFDSQYCLIVHSNCHGRVVRTSRHYSGLDIMAEPSLSLGKQINKNNIGIMHLHTP